MQGAREYSRMFDTGQYDKLYLVSGSHARGRTFRIFVLPEGEDAIPNGPNPPLNKNAVEVYGVISGNPGWTESYGWLHHGKWEEDFNRLVHEKTMQTRAVQIMQEQARAEKEQAEKARIKKLLDDY
jgi:hypothetical protein